jgi:hypothetical protein
MCNIAVIEFFIDNIKIEEFKGKKSTRGWE